MPAALDGPTSSGPMTADQATRAVLRASVVPTAVVGVLAVVVALPSPGGHGALAASAGSHRSSCCSSPAASTSSAGSCRSNPEPSSRPALLIYLIQIAVLFVLIALLKDATWLDPKVFAITVVMCTLAFTGVAVLATQRAKVLYVEPVSDEPALTTEADQ